MSSGPIIPARRPARSTCCRSSCRPSIESARTASPAYSTTWPTPPPTPTWPIAPRIMSFGVRPYGELPGEFDQHRSGALLCQRLGRQHVLDLGRPDADGERTESPVGGRVRIPADDRRPGWVRPCSGPITCTMPSLPVPVECSSMPNSAQLDLSASSCFLAISSLDGARQSRDGVIHRRHGALRPADAATGQPKPFEGLRRGDFVHEVEVDVEKGDAVLVHVNDVVVPHLLEQCPAHLERLPRRVARAASSSFVAARPHRRTRVRLWRRSGRHAARHDNEQRSSSAR